MKLRPILLALLLALLGVGVAPPSAYAGGPTSVLMSNPDQQRARAAYNGDPVYETLTAAIGEGRTGPNAAPAGLAAGGGEDVRLTWLIHDMQVWRIDRIHLTSADGMWIETVVDVSGESRIFEMPAHWHRPADEAALAAVLAVAGLLGDSGAPPTGAPGPAAEATVPAPAAVLPRLSCSWNATIRTRRASSAAARMRTASRPALRALPMATAATGTPAGICTMDSSESIPSRYFSGTGTPMTGSGVTAASIPGRCAAPPAPARITARPRSAAERP
jgi:hypothetical protein